MDPRDVAKMPSGWVDAAIEMVNAEKWAQHEIDSRGGKG